MASSSSDPAVTGDQEVQEIPARNPSKRRGLCSLITDGHYPGRRDLLDIDTAKIWNINVSKLHMNAYIIIGEQPTYPHNLITIKRTVSPFRRFIPAAHEIGTIVFWDSSYLSSLVLSEQAQAARHYYHNPTFAEEPSDEVIAKHVAFEMESNVSTSLSGEKTLLGLHTVWDCERDALAQFQFYNTIVDLFSNPIYAYGFVYGRRQYALFSAEGTDEVYSACFRGLSGPKQHAHIKAITGGRLLVLEPFVEKYRRHIIAGWSTTHLRWSEENGDDALLSEINLVEIALEVLKSSSSSSSDTASESTLHETPTAIKPYACFTPGYLETPASSAEDWLNRRNNIALTLGFAISRTKTYHLFQLTISLPTRKIRVLRTIKLANILPILFQIPAEQLFNRVAARCKAIPSAEESVRHVCNKSCLDMELPGGIPGGGLRSFVDFDVAQSVDCLELPRNGVRLLAPDQGMYRESLWTYNENTSSFDDEEDGLVLTDVSNNVSFESQNSDEKEDGDGDVAMGSDERSNDEPKASNTTWPPNTSVGSFEGEAAEAEDELGDSQASTIKPTEPEEEDPFLELALSTLKEGWEHETKRVAPPPIQFRPLRRTKATEGGLFGSVPLVAKEEGTAGEREEGTAGKREGSEMDFGGSVKRVKVGAEGISGAARGEVEKGKDIWEMSDSE